MMLMLNVPATVGLIALAEPIVALIYRARRIHAGRHRGHRRGADVLRARTDRLLGRQDRLADFYALGDSRTPVIVRVTSVAVNLGAQSSSSSV